MSETQAASSPAETDVFNGQEVSMEEFSKFRADGTVPERFKPADTAAPAPADTPKQTDAEGDEPENASDAATDDAQEQPQLGRKAQRRFEKLLAENKELQRKLEAAAKPTQQTASSPAQAPQPQQYTPFPKPRSEDANPDGTPKYKDWDQYNEALIDWKAEEKIAKYRYEQSQVEQMRQIMATVAEGEQLYGKDFGSIADQTAGVIGTDPEIPQMVKHRFARSKVLPHLTYVLGEDPDALKEFVKLAKTDPFEALDRIANIESGIRTELAKPKGETPKRGEDGKFAPEKPKTSAPKPPEPVGGGSSRAFDTSDESLSPEDWMRKRNKQLGKA